MTAEQLLKYAILELAFIWDDKVIRTDMTGEEVDEEWDMADCITDAINEIRSGGEYTGLDAPYSRHYESDAVAVQAPNGQWVGFTYWHGGGKHGEPESIDWIKHAYHLDCKEEEKVVTVRTFTKGEAV